MPGTSVDDPKLPSRLTLRRWMSVPGLVQRSRGWAHDRRMMAGAAVVLLITAVAASVALALPDTPAAKARPAADRLHPHKPDYLKPIGSLIAGGTLPAPTLSGDNGRTGVPSGTAPVPTTPTTTDITQRSAALATYQGGAGTLTPADIATLAIERGCSPTQAVTATAIAMAESGGSPSAQGDIGLMDATWDWSSGLWQIRGLRVERHTGRLRDSVANQAASKNAASMYTISNGCTDWAPWSTFNTGAYAQYMQIATQAAKYVVAYYNAHGHHFPAVTVPNPNASIPSQSASPGHTIKSSGGPAAKSTNGRAAPATGTRATSSHGARASGKGGRTTGSGRSGTGGSGSGGGGGGGNGGGGGGAAGSTAAGSGRSSGNGSGNGNPVKSILPSLPPVKSILPTLPPITSILPVPSLTVPHL